jgi:hypothetical protein
MFVKIHKSYRNVVAVCDSNLLGKTFSEKFEKGTKQLDIRESFYKGEEKSYPEVVEILKFQSKEDATFNIVGPESVKAAEEAGIIEPGAFLKIQNIPYVLVLL